MITLDDLQAAFRVTKKKATPHREPNFEHIREVATNENPEVRMQLVFLEEHNTGYDGNLERYMCRVEPSIHFQVDLLPGLVVREDADQA